MRTILNICMRADHFKHLYESEGNRMAQAPGIYVLIELRFLRWLYTLTEALYVLTHSTSGLTLYLDALYILTHSISWYKCIYEVTLYLDASHIYQVTMYLATRVTFAYQIFLKNSAFVVFPLLCSIFFKNMINKTKERADKQIVSRTQG